MAEAPEDTPQETEKRRQLSEEELEIAFKGSSISVNRTLITIGPPGVRLAFVETGPTTSHFRVAVTMSPSDAIALKDLLTDMLSDIEQQIKQAEENG